MEFALQEDFDETLRPEWNALLLESVSDVPFLQFDYLKTWWKHLGGGEWKQPARLAIITAREGEKLVGIAPCFVTQHENKQTLLLLGSHEISDFLDLIVKAEDAPKFISGLMEYIRTDLVQKLSVEVLDFYNLLDQSPSLPLLAQAAEKLGWLTEQEQLQHSPYIRLS